MKINAQVSKILTNKWVLNIVALLALLNVIGYMVMGNLNNVLFFIVLAVLVRYFSKNMVIVLGVPLLVVNLFSLKGNTYYHIEGMETNSKDHSETIKKINEEKKQSEEPLMPGTDMEAKTDAPKSSNVKTDEHFEVGRAKNGGSKIDYASTIESAYDELNKVLGSDGIKSLTDDTQKLMKQQMQLAESMSQMEPMIKGMGPMMEQAKGLLGNIGDTSNLGNLSKIAEKFSSGLGNNVSK